MPEQVQRGSAIRKPDVGCSRPWTRGLLIVGCRRVCERSILIDGSEVQRINQIAVHAGLLRFQPEPLAISGDGFVEPSLFLERVAEIVVDVGKIGFERENPFVEPDRLGELSGAVTPECGVAQRRELIGEKPEINRANRIAARPREY